jgi:hypothetical protein
LFLVGDAAVYAYRLIATKFREESNELEILRLLDAIQPKSEHVISLLDLFHTQSGSWAILPRIDSTKIYLALARSNLDSISEVWLGLIQGSHIFTSTSQEHQPRQPPCRRRLVFEKFNLAIQVKDEEVDDHRGTKLWIAPEVEERMNS